ncbi:ATP-binding cassette domain-containing protein [Pseudarthrobacter sp902506025]|uniref:ATP-binding cassette domain-containing protein n=1 Tax=Pseudarthrobacter sp. 902506025 TaxID=3155291 RepID=UPI00344B6A0F
MSPEARLGAQSMVQLSGLTKRCGRNTALDDVTLTIGPGEVFGYLGPNGAGKTTTIRLLMGMLGQCAGGRGHHCGAGGARRRRIPALGRSRAG